MEGNSVVVEIASIVTDEMRSIVGKEMRRVVSYPVTAQDIRRWVIAVWYPETPPRQYWDEEYARQAPAGSLVAPEDFNPFAWATPEPALDGPQVSQTAFSEAELGVSPPAYSAFILSEINTSHSGIAMRPGDVITGLYSITKYFEREGRMGHMLYTTLTQTLTNQNEDWIRSTDSVFIRY